MFEETRAEFETAVFAYYASLKAKGWSDPEEGAASPESLFWRHPDGLYGVKQIEAAWCGWLMAMRATQFAVLEEREACAVVAEKTVCDTHLPTSVRVYGSRAGAAIRARGVV